MCKTIAILSACFAVLLSGCNGPREAKAAEAYINYDAIMLDVRDNSGQIIATQQEHSGKLDSLSADLAELQAAVDLLQPRPEPETVNEADDIAQSETSQELRPPAETASVEQSPIPQDAPAASSSNEATVDELSNAEILSALGRVPQGYQLSKVRGIPVTSSDIAEAKAAEPKATQRSGHWEYRCVTRGRRKMCQRFWVWD